MSNTPLQVYGVPIEVVPEPLRSAVQDVAAEYLARRRYTPLGLAVMDQFEHWRTAFYTAHGHFPGGVKWRGRCDRCELEALQ